MYCTYIIYYIHLLILLMDIYIIIEIKENIDFNFSEKTIFTLKF